MPATVDSQRSLKMRDILRAGALEHDAFVPWQWQRDSGEVTRKAYLRFGHAGPSTLEIIFRHDGTNLVQPVSISRTVCNYGGDRPWFFCRCGKRVAVLFDAVGCFLCRHCLKLRYSTQIEASRWRPIRRAQSIRQKLGATANLFEEFPGRPYRMHRKTYARLRQLGEQYERDATRAYSQSRSLRFIATAVMG